MTAKEYLKQIETIKYCIRQLQSEINELRETTASAGSPGFEASYGSGVSSRVENAVVKIQTLEEKLLEEKARLARKKHKLYKEITRLKDIRYITILIERYVNCRKLTEIADEVGYSYEYTCAMHGKALQEFDAKILNNLMES